MSKNIIAITDNSAWLVRVDDLSAYVQGRLNFGGNNMPGGIDYRGSVAGGPDGVDIRVDRRLVFWCDDFGDYVTSGIIRRIVNVEDEPVPESRGWDEEGNEFLVLRPSWTWLMPFVRSSASLDAKRAFEVADLLVELKAMGRITADDVTAAAARIQKRDA